MDEFNEALKKAHEAIKKMNKALDMVAVLNNELVELQAQNESR